MKHNQPLIIVELPGARAHEQATPIRVPESARHLLNRILRGAVTWQYGNGLLRKPDQGKVVDMSSRSQISNHFMHSLVGTHDLPNSVYILELGLRQCCLEDVLPSKTRVTGGVVMWWRHFHTSWTTVPIKSRHGEVGGTNQSKTVLCKPFLHGLLS